MRVLNNTPRAGFIQWSDVNISYRGQVYKIADGSTDFIYVYWKYSDPRTFYGSDVFPTLGSDDLMVFLNKNGIHLKVPTATILDGSLIVPESILTDALSANIITTDKLASNAITTDKLAANSVGADIIASNAVLSNHIQAGQIKTTHIASEGLDVSKITGAVTNTTFNALETRVKSAEGKFESYVTLTKYNADINGNGGAMARLNQAETAIDQHTTAINLRATKSELDTRMGDVVHRLDAAESELSVQATAINQRVTTTTFNALDGRVKTAEGNISTQAGQINLKASQSDLDAAKKRLDTAESTLSVLPGQISSKVEKNGVISTINQSAEQIKINVAQLALNGDLVVTNGLARLRDLVVDKVHIKDGALVDRMFADQVITNRMIAGGINADKITTGKLKAIDIEGVTITGARVTGTEIESAETTSSSNLTATMKGATISSWEHIRTTNVNSWSEMRGGSVSANKNYFNQGVDEFGHFSSSRITFDMWSTREFKYLNQFHISANDRGSEIYSSQQLFLKSEKGVDVDGDLRALKSLDVTKDFRAHSGADISGLTTMTGSGSVLNLRAQGGDHVYFNIFPRRNQPNARGAYFGFASDGTTDLTVRNEIGNISINSNGTSITHRFNTGNYLTFNDGQIVNNTGNGNLILSSGNITNGFLGLRSQINDIRCTIHPSYGLRVANLAYNGYVPVYASAFTTMSKRSLKKNIKSYVESAVDIIKSTPIRTYHYNTELDEEMPHVGLIYDEAPVEVIDLKENGVDAYAMASVAWKAIQELTKEIEELKYKLANIDDAS